MISCFERHLLIRADIFRKQ